MGEQAAALGGILLYYFCIFPLQVIAIVTDSLTDLDIFKDLQEACAIRDVPVYVLLDQSCSPAFLKMCRNIGVCLDDLQVCGWFSGAGCGRVCTITARSGIKRKYVLVRFDYSWVGSAVFSRLPPSLLSAANEGANNNRYKFLHEIRREDYREGAREVYADRWDQSCYGLLQVTDWPRPAPPFP